MNYSGGGAEPAAASCRSQLGNHGYHTPIPPSQAERLALGLLPYKITIYTTLVLYRTYCAPDYIRKVYCKIDTLFHVLWAAEFRSGNVTFGNVSTKSTDPRKSKPKASRKACDGGAKREHQ